VQGRSLREQRGDRAVAAHAHLTECRNEIRRGRAVTATPVVGERARLCRCGSFLDPEAAGRPDQDRSARCLQPGEAAFSLRSPASVCSAVSFARWSTCKPHQPVPRRTQPQTHLLPGRPTPNRIIEKLNRGYQVMASNPSHVRRSKREFVAPLEATG
jgi:hypothetical protein